MSLITRLLFIAWVAAVQSAALIGGAVLAFFVGLPKGLVLAVALVLTAPIVAGICGRRLVRRRLEVSIILVAAPVWVMVAAMSAGFTSFRVFAAGDAVRLEPMALVVAAAIFGAILGTVKTLASKVA
jgi:hypothetical protein